MITGIDWAAARLPRLRERRRRKVKEHRRKSQKAWRAIARRMGEGDPSLFRHRARWRAIEDAIDRAPITFRVEAYTWLRFGEPARHG